MWQYIVKMRGQKKGKLQRRALQLKAESAAQPLAAALLLCLASSPHPGARWPELHLPGGGFWEMG